MGIFGGGNSSTAVNNVNTTNSGTAGNEGDDATVLSGVQANNDVNLSLIDNGAVQAAFNFANQARAGVEGVLQQVISDGAAARQQQLAYAADLKVDANSSGSENVKEIALGALLVGGLVLAYVASRG